jgi:multimeric flavodoxin WrbA
MNPMTSRRRFLAMAGAGAATTAAMSGLDVRAQEEVGKIKIIAVACSPRKGKTTATALQVCLDAAKEVDPDRIETELIELAGLSIPWEPSVGCHWKPDARTIFPPSRRSCPIQPCRAIVVGTPVYFANMTALCKSFIDRCGMFRRQNFVLSGKVGAVLAVGGVRSGGQELAIQSVQAALLCHEMIVIGDGRPTGHFGARLWKPATTTSCRTSSGSRRPRTWDVTWPRWR